MSWRNDIDFIEMVINKTDKEKNTKILDKIKHSVNHIEDEFLRMEHTIEEYDRENASLSELIADLRRANKVW